MTKNPFSDPNLGSDLATDAQAVRNPFDDPDLGKPATPGFIPTIKRTGGQMLTTAATSAEDVTGPNAVTKAVRETGQGIIDRNPAGITKLSDVVEKPWLAVKEAVGQFAPQIGAAAAGSFAGARVGGALGSLAGPAGTVAGAAIGGVAGGLLPIFTQEYGGIRQEQIESGQEDKGRALAAAIPATALERVGMGKALKVFKGVPGGASSIAKEVGKGALKEGATEGAQNVIEQWGAFKDPTTGENLQDTALATVMGGIGGGVMGGASGAFDLSRQRAQKPADPQAGPDAGTASDPAAPSAPPGMGFNPDAGTYTVFPDGSVALNSDLSPEDQQAAFDKRYAPPTNPTATPGAQGWTTEPGAAGQAAEQPASVLAGDGIPHENTRIVPELDAQPGVAQAALPGGIDMRGQAREFDTGSLDPQPPVPVKPSEAMGLDPAAGPMSAAAVVAVDSGLHQTTKDAAEAEQKRLEEPATQAQAATENVAPLTQATQAGDANVGQSPEVSTVAPVAAGRGRDNAAPGMGSVLDSGNQPIGAVAAAADPAGRAPEPVLPGAGTDARAVADETPAQRDWRNQLTAELATGMAYGKKLNPLQIKMRQGQLARATGAQMTNAELQQAITHHGPDHQRTAKLQAALDKRPGVKPAATSVNQIHSNPASWVLKEKATGRVVMETTDPKKVSALNTEKYVAVPIAEHLAGLDVTAPVAPVNPANPSPQGTPREPQANQAQPQQARQPEAPAGAVAGAATEVAPRPANWRGNFMQAAEQQSPKHPEGASMRDAQGQWQPAVRQGMEGRVAQPIDGAPTFAEAGAAARWSQLEQAKGQSGADEEALRRLQNRVPGRVDAVAPVASTAPAAAPAAQPGRELSRDIGKYKEGLSEHRANQVRSELARNTPGVIYTVEEDAALRNGYAVVGRALAPGQKLGMEKLRAAKGRAPDTSKVKDQAETTAAPAQPATKTVAPPAAKRKPRGVLAKKSEAEEKARADHFAPGNIVNGYSGQDRVLSYQPAADGNGWSVTVQAVVKQGNEWVDDPSDDRVRQHSTEPEPGELKAGPVQRAQTATKSIAVRAQPASAAGQKDAESDAGNDDIRFSRAPSDQTKTEAFKKWFGDSKVVDAEDKPLVVYHGAPDVRGIFAEGFKGRSRGSVFFAASDYVVADSYAKDHRAFDYQNAEPQTIPLYLSINNPMIVDANGAHWKNTESYVQKAKDEGHDGIIIRNSVDFYDNPKGKDKATTVYAWFEPSQAKSAVDGQLKSRVDGKPIANATGNNGNFDPENPDIRFSFAGENAAMALTDAASVRNAVAAKYPELASSIDRMLARGEQAQKGGLVVIESADARDIAEVYASKTDRTLANALRLIQGDAQLSEAGDIQGFYDPKSGLQFIVTPNVSGKTAPAVVLHEAVHGQQRADLDAKAQKMLNGRGSKMWPQKTRDFLARVVQRIDDSGETGNVKEAFPYVVEQAVLEGRQAGFSKADGKFLDWVDSTLGKGVGNFLRDLVATIRASALKRGFDLTPAIDDLVTLAKMAVHTAADGTVVTSKPRVAARPAAPALSRAGTGDQTQTEAFKKWFGDSKVVDAKGKPLVVYHGTGADFSIFSDGKIGSTWGADRIGHFFTSSTEEASVYANSAGPTMQRASGQIILPTYLAIQRPVTLEALQEFTGIDGLNENYDSPIELYDNMRDEIEAMLLGNEDNNWTIDKDSKASKNNIHDGVLLTLGGKTLAVAIESTQIKSAIGNNGDFNGENDDIRFSRSKTPKAPQAGTRTDRAVMDMVREGRTAQDILRLVAGTSKSRFNKQVARLLLKTGANPTVSLERGTLGGDGNFTFLARYSRKNDALGLTEGAQAQAEHIFMHEMMHAATLRALDRKGLASLQMRHLYAHVKKQGGANGQYGMKNVGEFVAEVFTNPDFQREIKGMRAPSGSTLKTAWDSFVRIMRSILGLNQDSTDALSRALELGVAVMRENMSIRTKASGADAYIADPNVVSEIQLVLDGARAQGHAPQKAVFGRAADWLVKSASVRGVDVEDFRHVLDGSAVRHMMKNHYDLKGEKSRGQIPLTDADLLALPSVVQNPDRVVLGTKNRLGREQIAYVKQLPDGSTLYLEEVRTGRKELAAVSARKYPATMNVESIVSTLHPNARGDGGNGVIVLRSPAEGNIQESGVDDAHFGSAELNNIKTKALDQIHQTLSHPGKVSLWDKTVGTMRHLAERNPAFKPVFESAQQRIDDVSTMANDAADAAPRILPRVDDMSDIFGKNRKKPVAAADNKAIGKALFEGTLSWARDDSGKPMPVNDLKKRYADLSAEEKAQMMLASKALNAGVLKMWRGLPIAQFENLINSNFDSKMLKAGVVWSDKELKNLMGMNDLQAGLYREARAAVDRSIDMTSRAAMLRLVGDKYAVMRDVVLEQPTLQDAMELLASTLMEDAKAEPDASDLLMQQYNQVVDLATKARDLMDSGYMPLSRFGKYTLDVVDADGQRQYFSMFESQRDANLMKLKMQSVFPGATVVQGTMSAEAFKLFQGVTPESLEMFGNMLGLESTGGEAKDKAFQAYVQLAKNNHSSLKRLIHRKGIDGYSEDVGRTLASFIYSNARQAAGALNAGTMEKAVQAIPKEQGELVDVAMGLRSYISDPQEEGQAVRGMLFAQYLGGSVASAVVNMTQPFAVTMPWLSQFGGIKKAAGQMTRALKDMGTKGFKYDPELAKAMKDAEDDGTVSPQEVHQLMAQARGAGGLRSGDGTRKSETLAQVSNAWEKTKVAWGQPFALAEQFNRRSTFIAAFRIAKDQGMANPAEFARKAVLETQFLYSKANKMKWARGTVGGTLMTFKTYSISYLELMQRTWNAGTPGSPERAAGRRAVAWAMVMLMLMGGAGGLPFMEDAEDLIDALAQMLGYNVSSKQWRKQAMEEIVGKELAEFLDQGISGLPGAPIDVSGRLGMGNLIPGTGLFQTKPNHTRDMLELAGPAGDLVGRAFSGAGRLLKGDIAGAALEFSPTAVRNAAKGIDMAASGMYKDTKGYKVIDTTLDEAIAKAIGFQPRSVAEVQEANSFMLRSKSFYTQTSSEIRAQWANAIFEKDKEQVQAVRDRLARWNENNPDQRINIQMPDIWKRVREMGKDRTQRIADTAPKALRAQMRQEVAQRRADAS